MELLEVCLKTTYFQADDKFFQQKNYMAVGALYHPLFATFTWKILRNWLLTQPNTSHRYGCGTLMTHLWSGLMAQTGYTISSTTSTV
jgi:hypothetical protein